MEVNKEKQRFDFLLDEKIPNEYVILERKYNDNDIKFYIQIESVIYSHEFGTHKMKDRKFLEKEFDDIDSAINVIKELKEQEKALITIDDKYHSVIFDDNGNVILNGITIDIK
jgi:hypothetical protein